MKLEIGKKYRTRDGEVRGPLRVDPKHPYRFVDEMGNWYGEDGHYWAQPPGCRFSLIECVTVSPPVKDTSIKIVTEYWAKPIPARQFDWTATYEGYEPGDPMGHGRTEQEAVAELKEATNGQSKDRS